MLSSKGDTSRRQRQTCLRKNAAKCTCSVSAADSGTHAVRVGGQDSIWENGNKDHSGSERCQKASTKGNSDEVEGFVVALKSLARIAHGKRSSATADLAAGSLRRLRLPVTARGT